MAGSPLLFTIARQVDRKFQFGPDIFSKLMISSCRNFWSILQLSGCCGCGHGICLQQAIAAAEPNRRPGRFFGGDPSRLVGFIYIDRRLQPFYYTVEKCGGFPKGCSKTVRVNCLLSNRDIL